MELYNSTEDNVRFAFEIILSLWIYGMMLHTIFQIILTQKEKGNFLKVRGTAVWVRSQPHAPWASGSCSHAAARHHHLPPPPLALAPLAVV